MKSHNRLRRVDDAVGIGDLHRKSLEELFVNGIQEVLLFGVFRYGVGRRLDGSIKPVEVLQELVTAEILRGQGVDDLLDLAGYDVAGNKFALLKTFLKMRSVRMCWISISSTACTESSGLMVSRQRA